MPANANSTDPWMQTIGLLSLLSGVSDADVGRDSAATDKSARKACQLAARVDCCEVKVTLIDRPSASTATIAWRDSTNCFYGYQVWRASRSGVEGVCAMSGRTIHRGDAVYQPCAGRRAPLNAGAMILTSVLDDAIES